MLEQIPKDILAEQLFGGFVLLVVGIAVVFIFLILLVLMTKIMSALVGKFVKEKPVAIKKENSSNRDDEIALAIVAAKNRSM